jgi:ACS family hexuronate transporter-like MFS transporter
LQPQPEFKAVFTRTALYLLIALMLAETTINYIDRQVVSVLAPTLRAEFGMTNSQYAGVVNAFLIVYAIAFGFAGWALDRFGLGRGLSISVIWWSIADMLHAFARGPLSLGVLRGLLAVGEASAWPAFAKAVAMWVPPESRLLAIGICNSGSSIGAMIAPPLVAWLTVTAGWKAAFVVTGFFGLLWTAAFLSFRYTHPEMAASEKPIFVPMDEPGPLTEILARKRIPWLSLMRYRQTWAIFACRFLADPLWYFFVFWIPEFLARQRGLSLTAIGEVAWIPFLVSGVANLGGGYVALQLQRSGWSVNRTRKTFMVFSTVLSPIGILAAYAQSLTGTIVLISTAVFCWTFWSIAVHSLAGEYFPPRAVASVYGFAGTGSTVGSAISTWAVGRTLDLTHNYGYVFIGLTLLMPLALLIGGPLMGKVEQIKDFEDG